MGQNADRVELRQGPKPRWRSPSLLWLSRLAVRRPILCLLALVLLTAGMVGALFRLELRTEGETLYAQGSRTVEATAADLRTFEQPEWVILLATSRPGGPTLDSPVGYRFLREVHVELRRLPGVRGEGVRSLADLIEPPRGRNWLYVRDFLAAIPESPAEFAELSRRIHRHPLTEGLYLSRDGRAAAFYVPAAREQARRTLVDAIESWIESRRGRGAAFDLLLTGPAVAEAELGNTVLRDLARQTPLMVVLIALLLFFSLRTIAGMVIPMAEVAVVLILTVGTMALCGVPITLVTTILPVVLMAATVTDEIQSLALLQASSALHEAGPGASDVRAKAVLAALAQIEKPIVLTSIATSLGFLSFVFTTIEPMRQFGAFNAFGMLLEMVLTFVIVPALVMIVPASWFRPRWRRAAIEAIGTQSAFERWLSRHDGQALALGLLLTAAAVPGIFRLIIQDSWIDNFDPGSDLVRAERDYNRAFWGSYRFDVVFGSREPGYFERPAGIALMEEFTRRAAEAPGTRGVLSYLVPYRIIAQGWGEREELSALSEEQLSRIAAWINVIRNRIDYHQFVTPDGSSARASLLINSPDYRVGRALWRYLDRQVPPLLAGRPVSYHISSDLPLAVEAVEGIVHSQLLSILGTLAGIGGLLLVTLRSVRRTVVIIGPVLAATAMIFGLMGYTGMPLGIATSMFASLAIGVGVTFGLYFLHEYLRRRAEGLGQADAVATTLQGTGRAIRWNAFTLALGFLGLVFSALKPNHSLGLLLALSMLTCYGVTLLYLPFLARWTVPRAALERRDGRETSLPGQPQGGPAASGGL
jgi:predicted RND superfamily exporter protein